MSSSSRASSSSNLPRAVDVLVVGGGPAGLVSTHILVRSGLKVLAIDQVDKANQAHAGRACMLYPGSLELLDLVGLYEGIQDIGSMIRGAMTYKAGIPVPSRGWSFVQESVVENTRFHYCFGIRQSVIESTIRNSISRTDPNAFQAPFKFLSHTYNPSSEYPITATISSASGTTHQIPCKYLIGADGSFSSVREFCGIACPGAPDPKRWVRLDAIVKTNIAYSRGIGVSIESEEYGSALFVSTDAGRTRIAFRFLEREGDRGEVSGEILMREAKRALRPFEVEFVSLDWWAVFSIGQRLSERYTAEDGRVYLVGDAAHTHSSRAAQGLNTGIHDAVNLAWKLAGVITGRMEPRILGTYEAERRSTAKRLIELNRDVATVMSGEIPPHLKGRHGLEDVHKVVDLVMRANAAFTVGLGLRYSANVINHDPSPLDTDMLLTLAQVSVGHRCHDGPVYRQGAPYPHRLRSLMVYTSRPQFWVLLFAGQIQLQATDYNDEEPPALSERGARRYQAFTSSVSAWTRTSDAYNFLTLISGRGVVSPYESLGCTHHLGTFLSDYTGEVFSAYGVDVEDGAVVVVRPDGVVCFVTGLGARGAEDLETYFDSLLAGGKRSISDPCGQSRRRSVEGQNFGEISIEGGEAHLRMKS